MNKQKTPEFIALMAFMMAITALVIDALMPALPIIGSDLGNTNVKDNQLLISVVFLGLAVGQLFFGPISDNIGRKKGVYIGFVLFTVGSLLSIFATTMTIMLLGRFVQGLGVSSPRTISVAMIRDKYEGDDMARIMSFIMVVFILVPIVAPWLGQKVMQLSSWRAIFVVQLVVALLILLWFVLRQGETLNPQFKIPFSSKRIIGGIKYIFSVPTTIGYTLVAGILQGVFLAYLSSAQHIFQVQYELGEQFPIYFGVLATSVGLAALFNGQLVGRFGMEQMAKWSLYAFTAISIIGNLVFLPWSHNPPLIMLMVYLLAMLFAVGILFGNLNALAMKPLGEMAGIGSTVIGFVSTLLSVPIGVLIGQYIDTTIHPLLYSWSLAGVIAIGLMLWIKKKESVVM